MKNYLHWTAIALMALGMTIMVWTVVIEVYKNHTIEVFPGDPEVGIVASASSVVNFPKKGVRKLDISTTDMVVRINDVRKQNNISDLIGLEHLHAGALRRAKFLYETKQWSHGGYNQVISNTLWYPSRAFIGENLAKDFTTMDQVIAAWMNSQIHKTLLLNSRFRYIGVAQFETYWVAWFSDKP